MKNSGNTFGNVFSVTTFGESHGVALGCIIDGCPAGIEISADLIQKALDRRRPGANGADGKLNAAVTARKEPDTVEILSGIFEGKTTGTPIALEVRNTSQHSADYGNLAHTFRPGHADYTYDIKYEGCRDYRGGGRSSGRETLARVAAGAVAAAILKEHGIKVTRGTIIQYIIVKGKGSISQRAVPYEYSEGYTYDKDYYIHNQLIPAIERIMYSFGYTKKDLEDMARGEVQQSLDAFF